MPNTKNGTTTVKREIFRQGYTVDGRSWHPTLIQQAIDNTKLLIADGFKPIILPDHPPEDEKEKQAFFKDVKSMGFASDILFKKEDSGFVVGGKLELAPTFAKEYNADDYPYASIGLAPMKFLKNGQRVGPHIDHIAIFGNKHPAFHDLDNTNFTSKCVEYTEDSSTTQEVFEMDPEKAKAVMMKMEECVSALKEYIGGGGSEEPKKDEVVVEVEGSETTAAPEKKDEMAADPAIEEPKKDEMTDKYTALAKQNESLIRMTAAAKAREIGIAQNKVDEFTSMALTLTKETNDPALALTKMENMFSGMTAQRPGNSNGLTTRDGDNGNRKHLSAEEYRKQGISDYTIASLGINNN